MWDFIESASYIAHGYCLLWQPWLIALYAGSDFLIFVAYAAIPLALLRFLRLRPDFGYRGLLALFAAFILLCGLTHLISILTLWYPAYTLHAAVKFLTGGVSLVTAAMLFPLVPVIAALPSPSALQAANEGLLRESAAHDRTLRDLRETKAGLEIRVAERTAELREANLQLETTSREAVHRARNLIAVVDSLARQTARSSDSVADMAERLSGRLAALAQVIDVTLPDSAGGHADLRIVAERQLAGVIETFAGRVALTGPALTLRGAQAQHISLALHELATNSVKYGALSTPTGTVAVGWTVDAAGALTLTWVEEGVPPTLPSEPRGTGFGTRLLTEALPAHLGGTAERRFENARMTYALSFPLAPDAAVA